MAASTVRLRGRALVAERTMAFHFDKPEGFQFKAGQSVDLTLVDRPESDDRHGPVRPALAG
jgi:ferredoxin-NADP reductase